MRKNLNFTAAGAATLAIAALLTEGGALARDSSEVAISHVTPASAPDTTTVMAGEYWGGGGVHYDRGGKLGYGDDYGYGNGYRSYDAGNYQYAPPVPPYGPPPSGYANAPLPPTINAPTIVDEAETPPANPHIIYLDNERSWQSRPKPDQSTAPFGRVAPLRALTAPAAR